MYQRLATVLELGKWPDGVPLTPERKENCLKIMMLLQSRHNIDAEHMIINTDGELVMKSKKELKQALPSTI
ncbi:MAG: YeaC family protein [Symbiopectobacterium sp.]